MEKGFRVILAARRRRLVNRKSAKKAKKVQNKKSSKKIKGRA
tara:strand:+ start:388 stop:513 length:126 start_codon:yes stop_codon:yes gene_type:complete